ncbi:hypothetical protein F4703DRAFT_1914982 [Phycomyces blakesleeanus]
MSNAPIALYWKAHNTWFWYDCVSMCLFAYLFSLFLVRSDPDQPIFISHAISSQIFLLYERTSCQSHFRKYKPFLDMKYFYVRIRNRHRKIPYPIFLMELYIIDKPFLDSDFQDLGCTGNLGSLGSIYYIKGNKFQKIQANNMSLKGVPIDTELMHPGLPVTIEFRVIFVLGAQFFFVNYQETPIVHWNMPFNAFTYRDRDNQVFLILDMLSGKFSL